MNQEDDYPPGGNGIGDACDCEGNFDCDSDCDGSDAADFKVDFGRSLTQDPCTNEAPCHGDFNCDQDCDGTDAVLFSNKTSAECQSKIPVLHVMWESGVFMSNG